MTINLEKGQKISLEKEAPGLKNLVVGLGWDIKNTDTGSDFDLDTSAFLLDENNKLTDDKNFIFFNNKTSPDGSVIHSGDNLTGDGANDDEQIKVDLTKIGAGVNRIAFTVNIHKASERKQNFGQVNKAYVRVVDEATNTELVKYDLSEDYSINTSVLMGELYKHNGEWKFSAVGQGKAGGLPEFVESYKG